jgi:hypothetical protein
MSSDSDIAIIGRAMKEHRKKQGKKNLAEADLTGFTKHTTYHYSCTLLGDRLDYWPSRKKFRWRNKIYARWQYKGTVQDFIADRLKRMNHE